MKASESVTLTGTLERKIWGAGTKTAYAGHVLLFKRGAFDRQVALLPSGIHALPFPDGIITSTPPKDVSSANIVGNRDVFNFYADQRVTVEGKYFGSPHNVVVSAIRPAGSKVPKSSEVAEKAGEPSDATVVEQATDSQAFLPFGVAPVDTAPTDVYTPLAEMPSHIQQSRRTRRTPDPWQQVTLDFEFSV